MRASSTSGSRVSLVMPAWNPRPEWLVEAVESALSDDGCDLELIVVDDGSDEPVSPLLGGHQDPRLRVVRVSHGGPYRARNAGLAATSGQFVRFVDADDIVEPDSTSALLQLCTASPEEEVIAYGSTLMCDEHLRPTEEITGTEEGHVAEVCLLGAFSVFHVSMLFPSRVVRACGGWPEDGFKVSGDWDFVLRALELAPVRRLDRVVTRYRRSPTSVMSTATVAAGAAARQLVLDRYVERHPDQAGSALARRAHAEMHLATASVLAFRGDRAGAAAALLRGARYQPRAAMARARSLAAGRLRRGRPEPTL